MINTIKPYFSIGTALLLATFILLSDFFFDDTVYYWVVMLWICLFSVILVMLGQFIHVNKEIKNYSEQLMSSKERLTNEIKHRLWAEKLLLKTRRDRNT